VRTREPPTLDRRRVLALGAGAALALSVDRVALARSPKDRPLIVILLRGGLDGQALLPAYADPFYPTTRGALALPPPGEIGGIPDLDGQIGLHPLAESLLPFWTRGELAVAPAVASPYRGRSHVEAQNVLESGLAAHDPSAQSGWLNRALAAAGASGAPAVAMGDGLPLILRGPAAAAPFGPSALPPHGPGFLARVAALYAEDPLFSEIFTLAVRARDREAAMLGPEHGAANAMGARPVGFAVLAERVGEMLATPDGPGVAVIEVGGWDTHRNQGTVEGPLARRIASLAEGLAALAEALGEAWSKSLVVAIGEFGRAAAPNETSGTDHGTGGAALVLGGGLSRAARLGAAPSLAPEDLLEGRDVAPTLDSRALFKGVLARHWGLSRADLDNRVFPGSGDVAPIEI
jgi:uncharacterized protein (DUF1501 family)